MPRFWKRYVDHICAPIRKCEFENTQILTTYYIQISIIIIIAEGTEEIRAENPQNRRTPNESFPASRIMLIGSTGTLEFNQITFLLKRQLGKNGKWRNLGYKKFTAQIASSIERIGKKQCWNTSRRTPEESRDGERKGSTGFRSKVAALTNYTTLKEIRKLVKYIRDTRKLTVAQSMEIYRTKIDTLLNRDQGKGYSFLAIKINQAIYTKGYLYLFHRRDE